MKTFPSTVCPIEADHFALAWPAENERAAVCAYLYRMGQIVWFETLTVVQFPAMVEEYACSPFGLVPIEELPWWLDERIRWEIARNQNDNNQPE